MFLWNHHSTLCYEVKDFDTAVLKVNLHVDIRSALFLISVCRVIEFLFVRKKNTYIL